MLSTCAGRPAICFHTSIFGGIDDPSHLAFSQAFGFCVYVVFPKPSADLRLLLLLVPVTLARTLWSMLQRPKEGRQDGSNSKKRVPELASARIQARMQVMILWCKAVFFAISAFTTRPTRRLVSKFIWGGDFSDIGIFSKRIADIAEADRFLHIGSHSSPYQRNYICLRPWAWRLVRC